MHHGWVEDKDIHPFLLAKGYCRITLTVDMQKSENEIPKIKEMKNTRIFRVVFSFRDLNQSLYNNKLYY